MIKILELFSGYGGASFALTKAGIEHECIGYSDIEKCANYIYPLNHSVVKIPYQGCKLSEVENIVPKQLGDITKIDENSLEDFDLLTGGFPCQSFSLAGKREGFEAANKGKLFFDIIRIAKAKKPRRMLLENVEGLLSHDNGKTFEIVLLELKRIGYFVSWKKLYSKNHGTPQNRPRVWIACFREQQDYNNFSFPETEKLTLTVKDLLEDEVDEKYYLTATQLERLERTTYGAMNAQKLDKPFRTMTSHMSRDNLDVPFFKIADFRYDEGIRPRKDGVCPTLMAGNSGSGVVGQPIIMSLQKRSIERPSMQKALAEGKPLPGGHGILSRADGIVYTLDTSAGQAVEVKKNWRRLTPRECFRLQGFFNDEINFGNLSDGKLYFLAGNGWDINTASKIFDQMFNGNKNSQQLLEDF